MIRVRERPPLRQHILVTTPNRNTFRWGQDEPKAENSFSSLSYSDTIPGGFESFSCTLPRKSQQFYQDLERLSDIKVYGAGGELAWQGRLERTPRDSGGQAAVQPAAVGYQAHLDDDKTVSEIYISRDLSEWQGMSSQRKINHYTAGYDTLNDGSEETDGSTGAPSLSLHVDGAYSDPVTESWLDAGPGAKIGRILASHAYDKLAAGAMTAYFGVADDDVDTNAINDSDYVSADSGSGTVDFTPSTARRWAKASLFRAASTDANEVDRYIRFTNLRWLGDHGLTLQGSSPSDGLYASDVIADAVSRWTNLNFTTGSSGTIRPTSFVIPQVSFRDMTTVSEIIRQCLRFGLEDWAVWDDKTFWLYPRGEVGRRWRARIAPTQLQETGPQVDRVWNGVVVVYRDAAGVTKTVGPTGSLADSTSDLLIDADPLNPANEVGIHRYATLDMGIFSTAEAATEVGRRFLEESKALDSSGSAQIVGWCEDDHGVMHPAWKIRAGDYISFVDASDTSYRRIVKKDYDHDTRTASIDLDAPPEGMDALLERLSAVLLNAEYGQGPIAQTGFPFKQGIGV